MTEVKLNDANITPDDSVSQVIYRDLHQRESSYVSGFSRASKASSISTARVKEAAKIAEIQAEAQALRQRQQLHETELCRKRQQYELQLKRDEF